jgi:hypothetical protein
MFRFVFRYPPMKNIEELEERAKGPKAPCSQQMLAWADCLKKSQVRADHELLILMSFWVEPFCD